MLETPPMLSEYDVFASHAGGQMAIARARWDALEAARVSLFDAVTLGKTAA
jgi:hypothetical protein